MRGRERESFVAREILGQLTRREVNERDIGTNERDRKGEFCSERDTGTTDKERGVAREILGQMWGTERESFVTREIQGQMTRRGM